MKSSLVADATSEIGRAVAKRLAQVGQRVLACGSDEARLLELDRRLSQSELHRTRTSTAAAQASEWIEQQNTGLDHLVLIPPLGEIAPQNTQDAHGATTLHELPQSFLTPARVQATLLSRFVLECNEWVRICLPALQRGKRPKKVLIIHELPDTDSGLCRLIAQSCRAQTAELARELAPQRVHVNALFAQALESERRVQALCTAADVAPESPEALECIKEAARGVPLRSFVPLPDLAAHAETLLGSFTDHVTGKAFTLDSGSSETPVG